MVTGMRSVILIGTVSAILFPCALVLVVCTDREYVRWNSAGLEMGHKASFWVHRLFLDAVVVLCASSLWLALAIRWRPPRSRGWPTPGRLAIMLTVAVFLLQALRKCLWWWLASERSLSSLWYRAGNSGALALIGGWILLRAVGGWRARLDPADQLGRVLGWCWLALTFAYWAGWAAFS